MSKNKIGVISLSVFIFLIVVISAPSFSNMNDIRQIEEYAESLKESNEVLIDDYTQLQLENERLNAEYERINEQYMEIIKSEAYCIAQEGYWDKQQQACW